MIRMTDSSASPSRLAGVLTLLGLGRLASWLTGERPRRSPLAGIPAIDGLGRIFDLTVVAPLLGLLRFGHRFFSFESRTTDVDPRQPPLFDSRSGGPAPAPPAPTEEGAHLESLLRSTAERMSQSPPSAPSHPPMQMGPERNLDEIRVPNFDRLFGPLDDRPQRAPETTGPAPFDSGSIGIETDPR